MTFILADILEQKVTGELDVPEHRMPKRKHVLAMMPAARRRGQLDRDPFVAIHLLVERNPSRTFL